MDSKLKSLLATKTRFFALMGVLIGLSLTFATLIIESVQHQLPLTLFSIIQLHREHVVLWLIDSTPIIFGFLFSYIGKGEDQYRRFFEDSPISLWEEDFSQLKKYFEQKRGEGIQDFEEYFKEHPEEVLNCIDHMKILNVNPATLKLYHAKDIKSFFEGMETFVWDGNISEFRDELVMLSKGITHYRIEQVQKTFTGEVFYTEVHVNFAPKYEETWEKVYVTVLDISARKQLEDHLKSALDEMALAARTDSLTKLLNRGALTSNIQQAFLKAQRTERPLCLLMVDIDQLKTINDQLGHEAGDKVLITLAETFKKELRIYDNFGRWGGDEFMVVLPEVDIETAKTIAERIRKSFKLVISKTQLGERANTGLSISLGLTSFTKFKKTEFSLNMLLNQADQALYLAKNSGRDQIEIYSKVGNDPFP